MNWMIYANIFIHYLLNTRCIFNRFRTPLHWEVKLLSIVRDGFEKFYSNLKMVSIISFLPIILENLKGNVTLGLNYVKTILGR